MVYCAWLLHCKLLRNPWFSATHNSSEYHTVLGHTGVDSELCIWKVIRLLSFFKRQSRLSALFVLKLSLFFFRNCFFNRGLLLKFSLQLSLFHHFSMSFHLHLLQFVSLLVLWECCGIPDLRSVLFNFNDSTSVPWWLLFKSFNSVYHCHFTSFSVQRHFVLTQKVVLISSHFRVWVYCFFILSFLRNFNHWWFRSLRGLFLLHYSLFERSLPHASR